MKYSVTLEHGSDGSWLAWVHELPGCFARGPTRADVERSLPARISDFLDWLRRSGEPVAAMTEVIVVEEVESRIEAAEDTEALVRADRAPLTPPDWERIERWLAYSRRDLLEALSALSAEDLDRRAEGSSRTIRGDLLHIAFVELMYAAWTFDLDTRQGLEAFLGWTRGVATDRMRALAERHDDTRTFAEWAGAPRREEWSARKAARRLIWHELLHLPSLRGGPADSEGQPQNADAPSRAS